MADQDTKARVLKLRKLINKYRYQYHVENKSEISDGALDSLKHELKALEDKNPELITPDSPTQRVEGGVLEGFRKISHKKPMLSLDDVFSADELQAWESRLTKLIASGKHSYFAEVKFDGLAISLIYRDGILVSGATRGDGRVGEDITANIKTIESVPLKLELWGRNPSALAKRLLKEREIEVRGEALIPKKALEEINKSREKAGEKVYANSRNLAAGSLRQLDPKVVASRKIEFFAYDIVVDGGPRLHSEEHVTLRELGFKTDPRADMCNGLNDVMRFHDKVEKSRNNMPYDIDGIVVSINENSLFDKLGVVGKTPRGAIAFKFSPVEATTKVKDIQVQVGRTGALTPVAHLEPVTIGGVTVSRATLHNKDEIKRLGLRIGDTVIVGRAGDVIPDIRRVLPELRTGKEKIFVMPGCCPVCGSKAHVDKGGIIYRCINKKCPSLKRERLYYFVGKKALDIDGLGPRTIDVLLDNGLIQDAADLFSLKEGDVAPLERYGDKSAENIIAAIQGSKKIPLPRFLTALGILHVGEETAIDLAENFGSLEHLIKASLEEIEAVKNIGGIVARSIYNYFHNASNLLFIKKLMEAGVEVGREKKKKPGKLTGRKFVFTGEMESMSRDAAKSIVRELGGEATETVSGATSFVVVGANPGSKYAKAQKLKIKILSEKDFLRLVK